MCMKCEHIKCEKCKKSYHSCDPMTCDNCKIGPRCPHCFPIYTFMDEDDEDGEAQHSCKNCLTICTKCGEAGMSPFFGIFSDMYELAYWNRIEIYNSDAKQKLTGEDYWCNNCLCSN